jgi:hydrogenase maturation protein HypF
MNTHPFPQKTKQTILALGAESEGNFCFFAQNKIYFSENFGDLLKEKNWQKYQAAVLEFLKKNKFKPDLLLTDLHPLYLTSVWGKALGKKYKVKHIQVQHHLAHLFSTIGEKIILDTKYQIPDTIYGIAMDGTGYGTDEKIWGGEVFKIKNPMPTGRQEKSKIKIIERIGHLENQVLIGGDLAIREPARMLISILDKVLLPPPYQGEGLGVRLKSNTQRKNTTYRFVKNYYTKNEFELIYAQLQQNFNCLETSSTSRVLDAVSLLLGFCENERKYKHEPIAPLETNSTRPYVDLKPKIILSQGKRVLNTTFLFEYLIKNLHKDKKRLAATAQLYVARGLYELIKNSCHPERSRSLPAGRQGSTCKYHQRYSTEDSSTPLRCAQNDIFIAGGIANNKIISVYLISQGAYASKEIPRGDAGLSFGQIICYLLSK